MEFALDSREAIERLRTDRSLRRSIRRIAVANPASGERHPLEGIINRAYFACGCGSGTAAVFFALALAGGLRVVAPDLVEWTWWKFVLAALLGGLAGKVAGLGLSRIRLNRALRRLSAELQFRNS